MSDIIKDAKQLLEDVTPGKWGAADSDIIAEDSNRFIATVSEYSGLDELSEECANVQLIASAPELAQALAEETYFYGVQVWVGGRWIMMLTRDHGTSLMHRGKWFERKDEAQACAAKWNHDTPTRIVRQRRSPVEEIE